MIIGNLKSNYSDDEAILRSWPLRWGFWAAMAMLLIMPQLMSGYQLYLATQATIFIIALVGLTADCSSTPGTTFRSALATRSNSARGLNSFPPRCETSPKLFGLANINSHVSTP